MPKYGIVLATVSLSLIMSSQASAADTTFSFEGTITRLPTPCDAHCPPVPSFTLGSDVSGFIAFDPSQLPYSNPSSGFNGGSVTGSYGFTTTAGSFYGSSQTLTASLVNTRVSTIFPNDIFQLQMVNGLTIVYSPSSGHLFSGNSTSFLQTIYPSQNGTGFYQDVSGFSVEFSINKSNFSAPVAAVPEPESYAMLLAGLGLIGAAVKRRKAMQA